LLKSAFVVPEEPKVLNAPVSVFCGSSSSSDGDPIGLREKSFVGFEILQSASLLIAAVVLKLTGHVVSRSMEGAAYTSDLREQ
jgi:hypothetical protein